MDTASILGGLGIVDENAVRKDDNRVREDTANRASAGGLADPFGFGGMAGAFGDRIDGALDTFGETRDGLLDTITDYFDTVGEIAPWAVAAVIAVTAGVIVVAIAGVIVVFKVL